MKIISLLSASLEPLFTSSMSAGDPHMINTANKEAACNTSHHRPGVYAVILITFWPLRKTWQNIPLFKAVAFAGRWHFYLTASLTDYSTGLDGCGDIICPLCNKMLKFRCSLYEITLSDYSPKV